MIRKGACNLPLLGMYLVFLISPMLGFGSWAADQLAQMSLDEKIGQLFVMPVCPRREDGHFEDLLKLMQEFHIGNVIVKQSDPVSQIQFLHRLQSASKRPLLVAADAEWGLAMRMADTLAFPKNMTLGAIQDLSLIHELGVEIGRQLNLVGVHMNLAPVADVNTNPSNPVIGMRSFGEDPFHVADCVAALFKGMQQGGVLPCAKHFPGHGDTIVDSHWSLPFLEHSKERLQTVDWIPFQRAIDEGIDAIMTAHLYVPSIDADWPTSLSAKCLKIARQELGFQGLIVSDALNMRAISDRYAPEKAAFMARAAGCDLLLYGAHLDPLVDEILKDTIPRAFSSLKKGYLEGSLSLDELDLTVFKLLEKKEKIRSPVLNGLESLHSEKALMLKERLYKAAVTLIGEIQTIPEDAALITFGSRSVLEDAFCPVSPEEASRVIVAIYKQEVLDEAIKAIDNYREKAIICYFASPYGLKKLRGFRTIFVGYENDSVSQKALLNVLLGKEEAVGKLPISLD